MCIIGLFGIFLAALSIIAFVYGCFALSIPVIAASITGILIGFWFVRIEDQDARRERKRARRNRNDRNASLK